MEDRKQEQRTFWPATSLKTWAMIAIILLAMIYLQDIGFPKLEGAITHSNWWLRLSLVQRHLISGIFTTGMGSAWFYYSLRRVKKNDWNLYRAFLAASLTIWGLSKLYEAAMLSQ